MSQSKMSRRERKKHIHKDEIMDASLKLFSQKGFYNVSMQEIADESDFGVGTIYNYFQSKENLFEEILTKSHVCVISAFSRILDGSGTEPERLSRFIKSHPEIIEKHIDVIKLYASRYGLKEHKLSKINNEKEIGKVLHRKIEQIIEQGIQKGFFRPVDPEIARKTLGAIFETLVFEITDVYEKEVVTEKFEKVEHLFLNGLLNVKE